MEDLIKCKMKVVKIMFPKNKEIESGDFSIFTTNVLELLEGDMPEMNEFFNTVSLKGNVPHLREGDIFTFVFNNPEKNKYGTSYTVVSVIKEIDPGNEKELKEYFKIMCGNSIAEELIKVENAYDMLLNKDDENLLKIKGIGEKTLKRIYSNIAAYSDISYAFTHLLPLGLTKSLINKICLSVGGAVAAVQVCKNDPYSLINKVKGISFPVADKIALECGLDYYSPIRLRAAIIYILETNGELGKSYLTSSQLWQEVKKIINIEFLGFSNSVQTLINEGIIAYSQQGDMVSLMKYIELESEILKELIRIRDAEKEIKIPEGWEEKIEEIEEEQGWKHTDEQLEGVKSVLFENIVAIQGEAGTGKTTIINTIGKILKDYTMEMCCLSARAAQRIREVSGFNAQTIHRTLNIGIDLGDEEINNPVIYADILIIDEASMVSGTLFLKLLKAIPNGCKVVILGDNGQLTAIGNCSVFSDLINNNIIKVIKLTQIHRQAKKSALITIGRKMRKQEQIFEKGFTGSRVLGELQDLELFVELESENFLGKIKEKFLEGIEITKNILEVQVISAMKTKGILSAYNLNIMLQEIVYEKGFLEVDNFIEGQGKIKIYKGDKIINTKNNYSTRSPEIKSAFTDEVIKPKKVTPIFNGSIGIVEEIKKDSIIVDFYGIGLVEIHKEDYPLLNLAYAITCHSAQGS